ncbi:hypothetical protein RP20_CCG007116 [Aedes albopictus]|nr:hypothetical protein RP20_CCG007116 [Aedes albopictus]
MSIKAEKSLLNDVNYKTDAKENHVKQYDPINGYVTSINESGAQQISRPSEVTEDKDILHESGDESLGAKQIKSVVVNFTSGTMARSTIQNQYVSNTSPHVQSWNERNSRNKIKIIVASFVILTIGLTIGYIFSSVIICQNNQQAFHTAHNICLTEECVLADQQQVILKGVLEESVDVNDNQATLKAKMFYKSCMDLQQIRKIGIKPIRNVLKSLGGWPVIEQNWTLPNTSIEHLIGTLRGVYSEPVLVELYVGADDKNSSRNILQIDQLVLALPSRDYYLKQSSEGDLKAYHHYMTQIAILLGGDPTIASKELMEVINFEVRLANASLPEADRHDTSAIYTKITLQQLQNQVPQINWKEYLQTTLGSVQLEENEAIVSYAMPYLIEMGRILNVTDKRIIHNYAIWRFVMSIMTHMIDDYQKERVEFRKILLGIQSERHRWSQCVEWTNKKLGMAVGALFIRDNFNQESKETALEMIHTIREAFNELLADIHWMDDETRAVAKEKADAMNERIGYPEILTNPQELEKEYINASDI